MYWQLCSCCFSRYCDCFANGEFCHMCNCNNCFNNLEHEEDRQRAIKSCLERNPNAFRPKIGKGIVGDERRHNKGCNCKRSGCLKNYCECYEVMLFSKWTVYNDRFSFVGIIHFAGWDGPRTETTSLEKTCCIHIWSSNLQILTKQIGSAARGFCQS